MLFLLFLHRRFRREKRRPHRSGPSFLLWNPRGRSPLVEPPLPVPFPRRPTPYAGFAVAPSPQGGTLTAESPLADRRCRFAVAPARCRCQLITTGWSASAGSPRHLYLSLSLSPCDSPWPTAAGRASSPWLRPRERSPSGGRVFRARCRRDPRGRPPPPLPLRFRYTSLDARSRNLKAKPQALNLKKSPPPAVRARPIPKPKPRGRARRLHLRLRLVSEASPCVRSTSPVAAVAGRASPSP